MRKIKDIITKLQNVGSRAGCWRRLLHLAQLCAMFRGHIWYYGVSLVPLNRPATVEGSVGKGAWCGRCWAMDTGPQKESDTTGSREEGEREKRAFQGYTQEPVETLQQYRQRGTNISVF